MLKNILIATIAVIEIICAYIAMALLLLLGGGLWALEKTIGRRTPVENSIGNCPRWLEN